MELKLTLATVRPWRWEDGPSLAHHADNPNVWINLRDRFPRPYTPADAAAWLERVVGVTPLTQFAIDVGADAVGAIGFEIGEDVYRRSAEIGYWLGEAYWGRGIATEALTAVTDYAFTSFDVVRIHASVFEWSLASMRVLEKAGYVCEARLARSATKAGRTIDQLLYARVRPD